MHPVHLFKIFGNTVWFQQPCQHTKALEINDLSILRRNYCTETDNYLYGIEQKNRNIMKPDKHGRCYFLFIVHHEFHLLNTVFINFPYLSNIGESLILTDRYQPVQQACLFLFQGHPNNVS